MPAALTQPLPKPLKEKAIQGCHKKVAQKIVKMLAAEG
jgi:hypothetical protein